jgi:hypothetical protein
MKESQRKNTLRLRAECFWLGACEIEGLGHLSMVSDSMTNASAMDRPVASTTFTRS